MNAKQFYRYIFLFLLSVFVLTGCGNSKNSKGSTPIPTVTATPSPTTMTTLTPTETSTPTNTLTKGYLIDSPLEGVTYICDGNEALTNSSGMFECIDTPVTFKIGDLTLGTLIAFTADGKVYPQDLLGLNRDNFTNSRLKLLARLLQSLDDDGAISTTIKIEQSVRDAFNEEQNFEDLSENDVKVLVEGLGKNFITELEAINNLKKSLGVATTSTSTFTSSGSSYGGSTSTPTTTTNTGGAGQKGPFAKFSKVVAYELVNGVRSGNKVETQTYDYLGHFSFNSLPWTNPTEIVITGQYLNENTGDYLLDGNLSAIIGRVSGKIEGSVNVNILTHIVAKKIKKLLSMGKTFDEAYNIANAFLKNKFNFDFLNGKGPETLDLTNASKPDNIKLLQISSALLNTQNPDKVLNDIADDAEDGDIDEVGMAGLDKIKGNIDGVNLSEVVSNMNGAGVSGYTVDAVKGILKNKLPVDFNLNFIDRYDVPLSTQINSNEVTLFGFDGNVSIKVENANALVSYSDDSGYHSTSLGTANTMIVGVGTTIKLLTVSSSSYDTIKKATLFVNGKEFYFITKTKSNPNINDTTPNSFNLGTKLNVEPSSDISSNEIEVSGLSDGVFVDINITGGRYSINGVDKGTTPARVTNHDKVVVKLTTSNQFSHFQKATITIGGVNGEFKTVTRAEDKIPAPFSPQTKYNVEPNTNYETDYFTMDGFEGNLALVVSGGEAQVEGSTQWMTHINSVSRGVRVKFRQTSSSEYDKQKVTTIKLGNLYHTTFTTITKANPALMDYTPRAFNLSKRVSIDEVQNQTVQSDDIPISGIANGTGIKIKPSSPNTMIKINNGNWTNGEISGVMAGDILKVKNTAVNASNQSWISTVSYYDGDDNEYKTFIRFAIRVYDSIQNPDDIDLGTIIDAVVPQSGFTDYYSNEVTISGLSAGSEVEAMVLGSSGYSFFSKNGGTWEHPHKVSLKNGDKIKFKVAISSSVGEGHIENMFLNFKNKSFKFSVTTNIAPIFRNRLSLDSIEVGDHIDFTPSVLDNQVVTFSLQNAPAWLSIDSATGKITGIVQSGSFSNVKLVATDSLGLSSFLPLSFSANVAPNLVGDSFGKEFILDDNSKNPNLFVFDFNISDIDTPLGDLEVNMTHEIVESRLASQGLNHGFTNSSIICELGGHCSARVAFEFSRNDGLHPSLKTRHYIRVNDGDKNTIKYVDIWYAPTAPILSGNQNLTISFVGNSAVANFHFTPTNSGNKAQNWTISNKPTWLEFNSSTGEVSTNTNFDSSMVGEYKDINITATNDRGSDSFVFNITVSQTPQQVFEVQDYYGVEINQAYSSFVVVDWLQNGQTAPISISGYAGQPTHTGFRVNGVDGVSTVQNGDVVEVWHLSSNSYNDIKNTTLTIGNSSDDFITQTKASSNTKLPLIVGAPNTSANLHERYSYTPQLSTDYTRFAPVTKPFEIQNKPDWADFNSTTGELSGIPTVSGEYKNVKIIAYGDNGMDDITFNITVNENQPPSLTAQSPLSLDNPDMNFTFNDNTDWRSKITQIGMFACYEQTNLSILNSSDYTISQGKLQLHVSTSSNPVLHTPSMGGARLIIQANGYNDDEAFIYFIRDGQYARKATIASDTQIKEHNISNVTVHLVLENGLEFRDSNLQPSNFFLIGGPNGLYINTITYIDSTHADLTLNYYGNDFDTNISFSVKIGQSELKDSECLSDGITSNAIPIIADVETPFVQVLYPDTLVEDDQFGISVSDKNGIIAVGANSGVYIYKKVDGNYTQIQKITPPDPSNTVSFGEVVALDGDYLVIGSGKYNNNGKHMAGIVYIYKKGAGDFYGYVTSLTPPDLNEYDHFGGSVDISNNMIIVGAYNALREPDRGGRGKAYLYKNDGSDNFTLVETITRSNGKPFDGFGYDVSITNDAIQTDKYYMIIGSYVHPDYIQSTNTTDLKPELGAGFANYYTYINNTLSNPIVLTPTDSTNLADLFGSNVSINNYTIAVGSGNGIYFYKRASNTVGEDGKISTGIGPNFNNLEAMFYFNRKVVVGGSKSYVFSDNGIDYNEYNTISVGNDIGYSASIDNFEVARGMYSNSDLVTNGGAVLVTNAYENITSLPNANASTSPNLTVSSDRSLDNSCLSFTFTQDTNWQNAISKIMYKAGETSQYIELSEGSDYEFTSNTSLCIKLSSSSKVALHTPYLTQGSLLIKATGYLDSVTSIDGVGAGNNAIKATITANPSLKEDNLDGADIDLTLENTLQFSDNSLDKNNFSLLSAPNGVTISSVAYIDTTHATVTLAFNHTNFDDNSSLSISISENELNSGYAQTTNSLNVEANSSQPNGLPTGATILNDINITIPVNSSTRIDTGINQNSNINIYSQPNHGNAISFLVGGETWNLEYNSSSCYMGNDSFIYKKDANEYGRVNITIEGFDFSSEQNRTVDTRANLPIFDRNLSLIAPVSIKTEPLHGRIYPYYDDINISKFNYYPNHDFSGIDFFEYNISKTYNECTFEKTVRVTINIAPIPPYKVAIPFPDDNGVCKVALTDGNTSLIYSDDSILGEYCIGSGFNLYKVNNNFLYQIGENQLHSIHQDATVSDLNQYQRNTLKTSQVYLNNYDNTPKPYIYKGYYWKHIISGYTLRYAENFFFTSYTPVVNENEDLEEPSFGLLPWMSSNGNNHPIAVFDFVGERISGDEQITSFAEIKNNIYFLGYDGANGNGISLACSGAITPITDECQGIQLYLNDFDSDAYDTSLIFTHGDIVSVLDKTLLFTYTHGDNTPKTKLFISDGKIDYSDSDEINKHVKLISDNEYDKLDLQKSKTSYTVFYKGKNLSTNKTEIGFIQEDSSSNNYRYLQPNEFLYSYICSGGNSEECSNGLLDSEFNMRKLVELDNDSKFLVVDNSHIYFTDYNSTSNGDVLYVVDKTNNTIHNMNINLLNINKARVMQLKMIGNYVYLLIGTTSADRPISLWKIDPTNNTKVNIESFVIQDKKYIVLHENTFNDGNSILYSVVSADQDNENDFVDFSLYNYNSLTDTKKLIKDVTGSLQF